jgi:pyruvate dehydrogenase E2 component (dihydrolipoamide acetyltransferase)
MAHPILMPKAGQSMTEGKIVTWLKKEGDPIERGAPILEIETDKANIDVEATEEGVLRLIVHQEGETIPVLTVIGVIGEADEEIDLEELRSKHEKPPAEEPPAGDTNTDAAEAPPAGKPGPLKATETESGGKSPAAGTAETPGGAPTPVMIVRQPVPRLDGGRRISASPLARRLAVERGLDIRLLKGSGPGGRILKRDIEQAPANGSAAVGAVETQLTYPDPSERPPLKVALDGMRGAIAKALQYSKSTIPHFYTTIAIDVGEALALKSSLAETGIRVTINDLVLRACTLALVDEPGVNCRVSDDHIEYPEDINLGIAVGNDEGLVVPVVLGAQGYDLAGLAAQTSKVIEQARTGKLTGAGQGTFTISNLGMFGIESFTAIINPPEAAILAVGGIHQQPVSVSGEVITRPILRVTLSCDHRAIDGFIAARFLSRIRFLLQTARL